MDLNQTLVLVILGALLGAAGQGARVIVGVKKEFSAAKAAGKATADWFDGKELGVSFILGAVAGMIAAISQLEPDMKTTQSLLMGLAGAGYAGADFIGGIMDKWLPSKK